MNITSMEKLKKIAQGEVVALPPFVGEEPFVARLKRPSLLTLAANGDIPNPLLQAADALFNGKKVQNPSDTAFKESADIFRLVAKSALCEPTAEQLEAMGLMLTDMQLLAIFNYTQMGVRALEGFRHVAADSARTADL